jgi:hypothetical protein
MESMTIGKLAADCPASGPTSECPILGALEEDRLPRLGGAVEPGAHCEQSHHDHDPGDLEPDRGTTHT